jgi:hypothetical protein
MKKFLALLLALLYLNLVIGAPDEAIGRVVSILGGDSFGVQIEISDPRTKNIDRVKLADVVSPSTLTSEGKMARNFTSSILKNKTVFLDIDDNSISGRNALGQLVCVVYLMDSDLRPAWPCFNRVLVDNAYATINDAKENEFNSSNWWQEAPKININRSRIIAASGKEKLYNTDPVVLMQDPTSSLISIGYRRTYFGKGETEKL